MMEQKCKLLFCKNGTHRNRLNLNETIYSARVPLHSPNYGDIIFQSCAMQIVFLMPFVSKKHLIGQFTRINKKMLKNEF